jgi:hypothetical protein
MVGCDACNDWFHPSCVGRTEQSCVKGKAFICPRCESKVLDRLSVLEKSVAEHQTQIAQINSGMVEFERKIDSKADVTSLNMLSQCVSNLTQSFSTIASRMERAIEEPMQRESRASNVIVRNMRPSENRSDTQLFNGIMEFLQVRGTVVKCFRFGPASNPSRPLKVELSDKASAQAVLARSSRLRESQEFGTSYLNADLTKYQQQSLESELETHLSAGESYTIRGNRVVPFRGTGENHRLVAYRARNIINQPLPSSRGAPQSIPGGNEQRRPQSQQRPEVNQTPSSALISISALKNQLQVSSSNNSRSALAKSTEDILNAVRHIAEKSGPIAVKPRNATPIPIRNQPVKRLPVPAPRPKTYSNQHSNNKPPPSAAPQRKAASDSPPPNHSQERPLPANRRSPSRSRRGDSLPASPGQKGPSSGMFNALERCVPIDTNGYDHNLTLTPRTQ